MDTYDSSSGAAMAGSLLLIIVIFLVVFVLIPIIAMWRVFTKAGKPGWASLVPIYNTIVLVEITGKPTWWFLLVLFPCTSFIFGIWTINLVAKSFGKSEGFTVGLIFLPLIFWPILGFGSAQYLGPSAKEAQAANRFSSGDYQRPFDNNPQA